VIKMLVVGVWASVVALASSYAAATFGLTSVAPEPARVEAQGPVVNGLEYRKPPALTVPMISDGRLRGYVVAKIVFTASAEALRGFPIDPQPFVMDEAFRRIYTEGKVEFDKMSKYNLEDITKAIKTNVNARLGSELIQDVLLDEINYVDKDSLKQDGAQPAK
jgi:flagellar basal body-associated protein FliL